MTFPETFPPVNLTSPPISCVRSETLLVVVGVGWRPDSCAGAESGLEGRPLAPRAGAEPAGGRSWGSWFLCILCRSGCVGSVAWAVCESQRPRPERVGSVRPTNALDDLPSLPGRSGRPAVGRESCGPSRPWPGRGSGGGEVESTSCAGAEADCGITPIDCGWSPRESVSGWLNPLGAVVPRSLGTSA